MFCTRSPDDRPLKSFKIKNNTASTVRRKLYGRDVHGSFVCGLRSDRRFAATRRSLSLPSLPPPPPHPWAGRARRRHWSVWVLVKVVQLVHAVAAEVLVVRRPSGRRRRLVEGLRRGDGCVLLAHVKQLVSGLVHLLLTDACHLRQLSLDTARVDVAKQTFWRQHLHHNEQVVPPVAVTYNVHGWFIYVQSRISCPTNMSAECV